MSVAGSVAAAAGVAQRAGARVESRAWTGWVDQKNFASTLATNDWILSLDADERVTPALAAEVRALLAGTPAHVGYRVPRVAFHLGRWIRTTDFYPDYQTRLYDRRAGRWRGQYVHESVSCDGPVARLTHELEHYSFDGLADQIDRLNRYSTLAARQMYENGRRTSALGLMVHPVAAFLRNYVLRRGFLDGTVGFTVSAVNACGVFLKMAKLLERQEMAGKAPSGPPPSAPGSAARTVPSSAGSSGETR